MYGYVFAGSFTGAAGDLVGLPGVRFVTELLTGYALFAAIEGDDAADLVEAVVALQAAGAGTVDVSIGTVPVMTGDVPPTGWPNALPPKFEVEHSWEAFVRVTMAPATVPTFLAAASRTAGVLGACLTLGQYDALVEVVGDTFTQLATRVAEVRSLPGVLTTSTGAAHLDVTG